jgi:hypothetical protein
MTEHKTSYVKVKVSQMSVKDKYDIDIFIWTFFIVSRCTINSKSWSICTVLQNILYTYNI